MSFREIINCDYFRFHINFNAELLLCSSIYVKIIKSCFL